MWAGGGGGGYGFGGPGGSGGESKLFPVLKAVRLLGVASRITIFMDCLRRATGQRAHSGATRTALHLAGVSYSKSPGVLAKAFVWTTVRVHLAGGAAAAGSAGGTALLSDATPTKDMKLLNTLEKNDTAPGTYPTEPCCPASTAGAAFSWPEQPEPLDFLRFDSFGLLASREALALDLPLSSGLHGSVFAARELRRRAFEFMMLSTSAALRLRRTPCDAGAAAAAIGC
jgi:hypothetical protein